MLRSIFSHGSWAHPRVRRISLYLVLLLAAIPLSAARSSATNIDIWGTVNYSISGNYVTLSAYKITNNSSNRSGTLRLELWAHSSYTPGTFYRLGYYNLGTLSGYYEFTNVVHTVAYTPPPDGTYYVSMVVTEWNGYDYNTYADKETFSGQKAFGTLVELSGSFSYNQAGSQVTITADKISNHSSFDTTGTIHLKLRATTSSSPYGTGWTLADADLSTSPGLGNGTIPPEHYFSGISITTSWSVPPAGTYYVHLAVVEWPDLDAILDYGTFNELLVISNPAPSVSVSANPVTITSGQSSRITWSSTNAWDCWMEHWPIGGLASTFNLYAVDGFTDVSPTSDHVYKVICQNTDQVTASDQVTVYVNAALPSVSVSANTVTIRLGQSSRITWSSSNAWDCWMQHWPIGGLASTFNLYAVDGFTDVSPTSDHVYKVICQNTDQVTASGQVTVYVPEPSQVALALTAVVTLMALRRRRLHRVER